MLIDRVKEITPISGTYDSTDIWIDSLYKLINSIDHNISVIVDATSIRDWAINRLRVDRDGYVNLEGIDGYLFDLRPPSTSTWIEYSSQHGKKASAILWMSLDNEYIEGMCTLNGKFSEELYKGIIELGPESTLSFRFLRELGRDIQTSDGMLVVFIDKNGRLLKPLGEYGFVVTNPSESDLCMDSVYAMAYDDVAIPLCTLSMMNVKNIVKKENIPDKKLQDKRKKIGKLPLVKFQTLEIEIPGKRYVEVTGNRDRKRDGSTLPLHLVRGHPADYTQGKGLFGKHKGVFWIPAHARGSLDAGVIKKRYETSGPD